MVSAILGRRNTTLAKTGKVPALRSHLSSREGRKTMFKMSFDACKYNKEKQNETEGD